MHATRSDLAAIEEIVGPLTRKLAARLAQKRRNQNRGRLDFRKTVRTSLATGGVPLDPKFKNKRPHKPELWVVCDVSGSVAAFARFTLMLVYAIQNQFSKVRSFVFIDGIDEVTDYFRATEDITEAIHRVNTEADVVWVDGHSDYGHAFEVFWERYGKDVGPKSTVLLLGDARNNKGDLDGAEQDYREILLLRPGYEPEATLTPEKAMVRYRKVRNELIEEMREESSVARGRIWWA